VAFKPDIDDLRESPALGIAEQVAALGCRLQVVEPNITKLPEKLQGENTTLATLEEALTQADVMCVLVKHKGFIQNVEKVRAKESVIDAVGLLG